MRPDTDEWIRSNDGIGVKKKLLSVEILGSSFTIQSEEDPDHLRKIVEYLKRKIEEVRQGFPVADPLKTALLAGLNVVDELFKIEQVAGGEHAGGEAAFEQTEEIERITEQLIHRIDESLMEN